jgi:diguanylate cyclase (GGDEF)-like protein
MIRRIAESVKLAVRVAVIGFDMAFHEHRDMESILGFTDELTQLPNLKAFERARRHVEPGYALVLIDIDNFKQINDTRGHLQGDAVLRRLAGILNRAVGGNGTSFRLHGDEFALLVRRSEVEGICREIQAGIRQGDSFSVSQGIVDDLADNVTDCEIGRADEALYRNKRRGKGVALMALAVA